MTPSLPRTGCLNPLLVAGKYSTLLTQVIGNMHEHAMMSQSPFSSGEVFHQESNCLMVRGMKSSQSPFSSGEVFHTLLASIMMTLTEIGKSQSPFSSGEVFHVSATDPDGNSITLTAHNVSIPF